MCIRDRKTTFFNKFYFRIHDDNGEQIMERKIEFQERRLFLAISYYNGVGQIYFDNKV